MSKNLNLTHAHLRRDYKASGLFESQMKSHPMDQFSVWFAEAVKRKVVDANAFVLATADKKARPAARVLLMKGFSKKGITFFTNYTSDKGLQLAKNPLGEAVFFWNSLSRQVRLNGLVTRLSRKESLSYFQSRPQLAQIAACASDQSRPVSSREALMQKFEVVQAKFKSQKPILPEDWGGYQLQVQSVEFWQGQPDRLHDRVRYELARSGKTWLKIRIQP